MTPPPHLPFNQRTALTGHIVSLNKGILHVFKLRGLIVQRKGFITTFGSQKRATGFHWRAKHFELNFIIENLSTK